MVECGKVEKVHKNGYCVVSFDRRSACDQCHMCAVRKDGKKVELTVSNVLEAEAGDTVEVTMADHAVLTSAVIVYIIPLILVALAVWIGGFYSELTQVILTVAALVIGFMIAVVLGRVIKNKKGYAPVITKVIRATPDEIKEIDNE